MLATADRFGDHAVVAWRLSREQVAYVLLTTSSGDVVTHLVR